MSCVGKTSLLTELKNRNEYLARSCGQAVKDWANDIGVQPSDLSYDEHRKIDNETLLFAKQPFGNLVIEGTFLDVVLSGINDIKLVKLICDEDERARRFMRRSGFDAVSRAALKERDQTDLNLRRSLYGLNPKTLVDWIVLNTTSHTISELAEILRTAVKDEMA